MPTWNNTTKAN